MHAGAVLLEDQCRDCEETLLNEDPTQRSGSHTDIFVGLVERRQFLDAVLDDTCCPRSDRTMIVVWLIFQRVLDRLQYKRGVGITPS